jgi:hypothetical protein
MANFPTLTPSSRTFTPGRHPHSEIPTLSGLQTRVRTSNVILEQRLRLSFAALTETEMLSIRTHYIGQQGRFLSFTIPDNLLSGMSAPASFTPTGYSWTYVAPPQISDVACGRYDVSVELATVPPEGANVNGAEFSVNATIAAGAGGGTANTTGFDLTVAGSLESGQYGGDVEFAASGANLSVDVILSEGAASAEAFSHSWSDTGSTTTIINRVGFRFTVGANDITCGTFGVFMPGNSIVERVRIHRVDTGALMASADITSVANTWVDVAITPVLLSAGVQYVISSRRVGGSSRSIYRNHSGLTFDSAIGSIVYRTGLSDDQPTSTTANVYAFARFSFS